MPYVEVTRTVRVPRRRVWEVASDFASFPRFMPDVESLTILERGEGWEVSEWVARLQGRTIRWCERADFDPAAYRIRYRQTQGDLKKFEGEWRFDPAGADGEETLFTLTCEFEFGIPVLAALLNPVAARAIRSNLESMMEAIEREAAGE